jgi:hypothetical protein
LGTYEKNPSTSFPVKKLNFLKNLVIMGAFQNLSIGIEFAVFINKDFSKNIR